MEGKGKIFVFLLIFFSQEVVNHFPLTVQFIFKDKKKKNFVEQQTEQRILFICSFLKKIQKTQNEQNRISIPFSRK